MTCLELWYMMEEHPKRFALLQPRLAASCRLQAGEASTRSRQGADQVEDGVVNVQH